MGIEDEVRLARAKLQNAKRSQDDNERQKAEMAKLSPEEKMERRLRACGALDDLEKLKDMTEDPSAQIVITPFGAYLTWDGQKIIKWKAVEVENKKEYRRSERWETSPSRHGWRRFAYELVRTYDQIFREFEHVESRRVFVKPQKYETYENGQAPSDQWEADILRDAASRRLAEEFVRAQRYAYEKAVATGRTRSESETRVTDQSGNWHPFTEEAIREKKEEEKRRIDNTPDISSYGSIS